MKPATSLAQTVVHAAAQAHARGARYLLSLQHDPGYWHAELYGGDTTLESDFILLELWQHPPVNGVWNPPTRALIDKAVASILARQSPDGGFPVYPGGPADVSAGVKAYFALKVAGVPTDDPRMARLRAHSFARGDPGGQQLRQTQPEFLRSLPASLVPQRAPGDDPAG
jgi:squalene-hopene/tetraprenyl-beta-curcumene cyclase